MPASHYQAIHNLKNAYNKMPWYQKLFFPYQLASELNAYSEQNSTTQQEFRIFKAFENNTWFFQRLFFSSLQMFYKDPYTVELRFLNSLDLLTREAAQANFNALVSHEVPKKVTNILYTLNIAGLLTCDMAQANLDATLAHQDPSNLCHAIGDLNRQSLLTSNTAQANFNTLVAHERPSDIADLLCTLSTAGLLASDMVQANLNTMLAHPKLRFLKHAIRLLNNDGLLTGESAEANFKAIIAPHEHPIKVTQALQVLSMLGLLTGDAAQANRDAVARHHEPTTMARFLRILNTAGLLAGNMAQANRDAIVAHYNTTNISQVLDILNTSGLLTGDTAQANFNAVFITHADRLFHDDTAMPYQQALEAIREIIAQQHMEAPSTGSTAFRAYVQDMNPASNTNQGAGTISIGSSLATSNLHTLFYPKVEDTTEQTTLQHDVPETLNNP